MNPYAYQQNAVYQTPYCGAPMCGNTRGVSWIAIALVVFLLLIICCCCYGSFNKGNTCC